MKLYLLNIDLRKIFILILVVGLGLVLYALTLPDYKDGSAAENLLHGPSVMTKDEYYRLDAQLRTGKKALMDLGGGLATASATILIFLLITRTRRASELKHVRSFGKRSVFVSANIAWLSLIPGTFWYYFLRAGRGDYPSFADSIAIPIYSQTAAIFILLVPLNLFLLLATYKTNLPTRISATARRLNVPAIFWECLFGLGILFCTICLSVLVADGDHVSIIVCLFFILIFIALRAGKISRY